MPKGGDSIRKELVNFKCQECYKIFFSIDDLNRHGKEHRSKENDFMTEHEGKKYEEKNAKIFSCVMCDERFSKFNELRKHKSNHSEKPFKLFLFFFKQFSLILHM